METLKKYSNPDTVLKLAKKYYKKHPPQCTRRAKNIKNQCIGLFEKSSSPSPVGLYISTRKNKKYMLYNGCKQIHFGQLPYEDYTKHKNKTRRQNYLQRSKNIRGNWKSDYYSPNNLAIHLLW